MADDYVEDASVTARGAEVLVLMMGTIKEDKCMFSDSSSIAGLHPTIHIDETFEEVYWE